MIIFNLLFFSNNLLIFYNLIISFFFILYVLNLIIRELKKLQRLNKILPTRINIRYFFNRTLQPFLFIDILFITFNTIYSFILILILLPCLDIET